MDYNLRDLKFFETVATLGNVSRAAEVLGRSQPAITKCIRRLESAVGERLIERDAQGVALTPSGLLLLERARPLLQHASQVQQELRDFSTGATGHVRIGSGLSTAAHVLPQICAQLLSQSGIQFEVLLGTNIGMRRELREGRIDLLLGLLPPESDLRTVPLVDDVVGPAVRAGHPLAGGQAPSAADLMAWSWAMPTQDIPSRQWWHGQHHAQQGRRDQAHVHQGIHQAVFHGLHLFQVFRAATGQGRTRRRPRRGAAQNHRGGRRTRRTGTGTHRRVTRQALRRPAAQRPHARTTRRVGQQEQASGRSAAPAYARQRQHLQQPRRWQGQQRRPQRTARWKMGWTGSSARQRTRPASVQWSPAWTACGLPTWACQQRGQQQ